MCLQESKIMSIEKSEHSEFRIRRILTGISREEFLRKFLRAGLLLLLGAVAYILGDRIIRTSDCSSCPGNGFCKDGMDCSNYLAGK